jgi:hypothetical protein
MPGQEDFRAREWVADLPLSPWPSEGTLHARRRSAGRHAGSSPQGCAGNERGKDFFALGGSAEPQGEPPRNNVCTHIRLCSDARAPRKAGPLGQWLGGYATDGEKGTLVTDGRDHVRSPLNCQDRWIGKTDGSQRATSLERTVTIQVVWMEARRCKNV